MQIWIHDSKMKKIVALNNDIPDMLHYSNSTWHPYLEQATSTFDFTISKFVNGKLHDDIKLINDECFVSFYANGSYQVFYIATLVEDDFNIQLTCNNTNLEYALEYANPFSVGSAMTIEWYLNHMDLLSFAAVEIGYNEIPDRKRTLTFDSQETKATRLQSLMSQFEAEYEFKVDLNRDGTYKRIVINIYQKPDETHHGIGKNRSDVVLYYDNGLKGVQVTSDKTQMFNAGVFTGKDGLNLGNVEISEKNADGIEEYYSRKGNVCLYAPLAMARYPATMRASGQDNWIRKDFTTEYENINDLKAYALKTLKQYAYPLMTYTASVQSKFVGDYSDLALGDTVRIIDKNFAGGLALEARVSEMIISFDNPTNNSLVFTNYRKIDNKPTSALQSRIDKAVEDRLPYRIELATTDGITFKNNEGETIVKPSLYRGNLPYTTDVTWRWALDGVATVGMQYLVKAKDIDETAVLTVAGYVGNKEVATTEITLTNVNDGAKGDDGKTSYLHLAFASSADGRTGFSFTESGQQYQGYYTDFTQSSSTDPTKYTWMDRRAGVEVGGVNLLHNSKGPFQPKGSKIDNYVTYSNAWINMEKGKEYTLSAKGTAPFTGSHTTDKEKNEICLWLVKHDENINVDRIISSSTTGNNGTKFTWNDPSGKYYLRVNTYKIDNSNYAEDIQIEEGNIKTTYTRNPEDVQSDIDSKADQALTQQQLNALAEQNSIVKAEMEAKASIDTVNQWITAYQNYVAANDEARAESEKNLQEAAARILQLKTDVGALRQQWDFIDTYMSIQNEGLIIGKSDGSAFAKFANDRISLFSGSSEVMYISQGTLHIENGIFTKTIQIGRFRFETHPADQDMLVLRYLGG